MHVCVCFILWEFFTYREGLYLSYDIIALKFGTTSNCFNFVTVSCQCKIPFFQRFYSIAM